MRTNKSDDTRNPKTEKSRRIVPDILWRNTPPRAAIVIPPVANGANQAAANSGGLWRMVSILARRLDFSSSPVDQGCSHLQLTRNLHTEERSQNFRMLGTNSKTMARYVLLQRASDQ